MPARAALVCALVFLLVALGPAGSEGAGNVPFKTSFVASSEYAVRRSGPLSPLPLANPESQYQPESISGYDIPIDESAYLLKSRDFDSIRGGHDTPTGLHHEDQSGIQSQSDDLVAASSAQTGETETAREQATTLGSNISTSSAPITTESDGKSNQTAELAQASTTVVPTTSQNSTSFVQSSTPTSSTASPTTSAPTTATSTSHSNTVIVPTSNPTTSSAPSLSTTTGVPPISTSEPQVITTTNASASASFKIDNNQGTTTQAGIANTTELVRPTESSTPVSSGGSSPTGEPRIANGRSLPCDPGDTSCGYVVASMPVLDTSGNKTRIVSEFILVPEEPSLNFEDSSYPTRKPEREPEPATLKAEHRTVDSDATGDELELDYINVEPIEPRLNARTGNSELTSTSSPSSVALKVLSGSSTPLPAVTEVARVTSPSGTPAASQPLRSTSVRVESSLRVESSSSAETSAANQARLASQSTTTSAGILRASSVRPNQKLLRLNEPLVTSSTARPSSTTTTTTTSTTTTTTTVAPIVRRLPVEPTRRAINNRRARPESSQHRAYFGEPTGDRRRIVNANSSNLSPVANGADEEEAKILTRYSIPSQLSRLSAPVTSSTSQPEVQRSSKPQRRFTNSATSTTSRPRDSREPKRNGHSANEQTDRRRLPTTTQLPVRLNRKQHGASSTPEQRSTSTLTSVPEYVSTELSTTLKPAVASVDSAKAAAATRIDSSTLTLIASSDIDRETNSEPSFPLDKPADTKRSAQIQQVETTRVTTTDSSPVPSTTSTEVSRFRTVTSARHQPSSELLDEFEGSIEDQLAKDALHSRSSSTSQTSNARKMSNTYSRSTLKSRGKSDQSNSVRSTSTSSSSESNTVEDGSSQQQLPGRPGVDYPVHWQVPKTSFDCRNYEQSGFYADIESDCQAYHSCHKGRGGRHTFLCPNGTLFSQELLTCDWWYNVECSATKLYMPNESTNNSNQT